jgi:hypothetical protein
MRRILPITAAFTLAMAGVATAGPGTGGPVSDRFTPAVTRPASTRPASTRPATAPAAPAGGVDETWVNAAATEFLRAVDAGEDERAYQLTTADYREPRPLAEFKKEMDKLRADLDVRRMRFQIFATPRRALAMWPTSRKTTRKSVTVGLVLALEEGAWRVDHVEFIEGGVDRTGEGFVAGFMKANRGARPVPNAQAGRVTVSGRVTKVDEKSVTIEPTTRGKAGQGGKAGQPEEAGAPAAERTLAVDAATRVLVPVRGEDRKSPGSGRTIPYYRGVPGKLADVKVGQQVEVEIVPGQDRATRISIDVAHAEEGL